MNKTITEQLEDLQNKNTHLKEFEKACKTEFGTGTKNIKKMLKKSALIST